MAQIPPLPNLFSVTFHQKVAFPSLFDSFKLIITENEDAKKMSFIHSFIHLTSVKTYHVPIVADLWIK